MSVKVLRCPKCSSTINTPAAMLNVRCPQCGAVFAAASAAPASSDPRQAAPTRDLSPADREEAALKAAAGPEDEGPPQDDKKQQAVLMAGVAGGVVMLAILGLLGAMFIPSSSPEPTPEDLTPVLREASEEELAALTIVDIPEEQRRRIYDDVRATARTSTEKALMIPGGKVRKSLENMLDATYENSLRQLAALHDITLQDVRHIVEEGDLKNWDPRARSRAYRDGERVYEDERTRGFKGKGPIL